MTLLWTLLHPCAMSHVSQEPCPRYLWISWGGEIGKIYILMASCTIQVPAGLSMVSDFTTLTKAWNLEPSSVPTKKMRVEFTESLWWVQSWGGGHMTHSSQTSFIYPAPLSLFPSAPYPFPSGFLRLLQNSPLLPKPWYLVIVWRSGIDVTFYPQELN